MNNKLLFTTLAIFAIASIKPNDDAYLRPEFLKRLATKIHEEDQIDRDAKKACRAKHDEICKTICGKSLSYLLLEEIKTQNPTLDDLGISCGKERLLFYLTTHKDEIDFVFGLGLVKKAFKYHFQTKVDELKKTGQLNAPGVSASALSLLKRLADVFDVHPTPT